MNEANTMRRIRAAGVAVVALILVLIVALFVWIPQAQHTADTAKTAARAAVHVEANLRSDARAECERVQQVRSEVNTNTRIIHDVLHAAGVGLLHQTAAPPRPVARRLRHATRSEARTYLTYAQQERYHPPTDCKLALAEGTRYHRPADRPYRP